MSEQNKVLVRRWIEEHDRQKTAPIEFYGPGYVLHMSGFPPMDAVAEKQLASQLYAAFPDLKHTILDVIAEGDRVCVNMSISGTHRAELMGIPPTGKKATISAMGITRIGGSKIQETWFLFDQLGMMQQLGAIPAPGQAR